MTTSDQTVLIYATGLVCMGVCAPRDMHREDVEARVNEMSPSGIASPWAVSDDAAFATGEPNPHECEKDRTRVHYLMNC